MCVQVIENGSRADLRPVNAGGVRRLGRHPAEIPLSVAAMEIWHEIQSFIGHDDCGFHKVGQVKMAENEAEMKQLEERVAQVRASVSSMRSWSAGTSWRNWSQRRPITVSVLLCAVMTGPPIQC